MIGGVNVSIGQGGWIAELSWCDVHGHEERKKEKEKQEARRRPVT